MVTAELIILISSGYSREEEGWTIYKPRQISLYECNNIQEYTFEWQYDRTKWSGILTRITLIREGYDNTYRYH